jgi:hypothetical protein
MCGVSLEKKYLSGGVIAGAIADSRADQRGFGDLDVIIYEHFDLKW